MHTLPLLSLLVLKYFYDLFCQITESWNINFMKAKTFAVPFDLKDYSVFQKLDSKSKEKWYLSPIHTGRLIK